jgi:hypothetical protein
MRNELTLNSARLVNGGKISLEFTQEITTENSAPKNILGMLNASDERFKQSGGKTYAWVSAVPEDAGKLFDIDFSTLESVGDVMELGIVNPTINGSELNIQIVETTKGNEWEVANLEKSAKRAGKDGDYITTKDGQFIYRRASIVLGAPKHSIITETERMSAANSAIENAIG